MIDLIKFFFAGEDKTASGRKIITYICALGLGAMFTKILMGTAPPEASAFAQTIIGMVIGFYFGKK